MCELARALPDRRRGPGDLMTTTITPAEQAGTGVHPGRCGAGHRCDPAAAAPAVRRRSEPGHRRTRAVHRGTPRAGHRRPGGPQAADAARPDRGQPVLRGFHPDPDLLRTGRQAALRGRHHLLRQGVVGVQGGVAQGHRLDPAGDGRRRGGLPALVLRCPATTLGLGRRARDQRRRRHPRAPHPGAAGRVHAAPAPGRAGRPTHRGGRRRPALPGRAIQRAAAVHPRARR